MRLLHPFALACLMALPTTPLAAQTTETETMAELALFLTIKTQPGKRNDLVALWERHLRDRARESDQQIRYVLALDMADPDTIRISEVYATKAAFEANAQAPWFAEYMAEAGPLLATEPEFHMTIPHWVK